MQTLVDAGADALELGIPFSDPLADGPVIQGGNTRALQAGTTPKRCFDIIAKFRQTNPDIPIGLLVYANLVYRQGLEAFYEQAAKAGVDAVLVGDVPLVEAAPFQKAAIKAGVGPVFFATPNGDQATLEEAANKSQGFIYLLSRAGVTGTESKAGIPVDHMLKSLKGFGSPPGLLGFGISNPEQVKEAIAAGVDGVIAGSAVVQRIAENLDDSEKMREALKDFVKSMKAATL